MEETLIILKYERLEKHCSFCHRLTHEANNCPEKDVEVEISSRNTSYHKDCDDSHKDKQERAIEEDR